MLLSRWVPFGRISEGMDMSTPEHSPSPIKVLIVDDHPLLREDSRP